jgi:hypothetical protein
MFILSNVVCSLCCSLVAAAERPPGRPPHQRPGARDGCRGTAVLDDLVASVSFRSAGLSPQGTTAQRPPVLTSDFCGGTTTLGAVPFFTVANDGAKSMNPNRAVTPTDLGSILNREAPPSPASPLTSTLHARRCDCRWRRATEPRSAWSRRRSPLQL